MHKGILQKHIDFVGAEWNKISRAIPVRWLCLKNAEQNKLKC